MLGKRDLRLLTLTSALLALTACGGDEPDATTAPAQAPATEPPPAEEAPPAAETETDAPGPTEEAPVDEAPSVTEVTATPSDGSGTDLLHTVRTTVSAPSVYRGDMRQVGRLYDGEIQTAWNSQTLPEGDDSPRSILVTLPEDVTVSAVDITAGYTRVNGTRDLFTGNIRITKVRVHHGAAVVEATLDVNHRGLQRIPISGGSGNLRIELAEWQAGERADWRELCVSEIRVVGEAGPGAPLAAGPQAAVTPQVSATGAAPTDATEGAEEDATEATAGVGAATLTQRDGLHLSRITLCEDMDGIRPVEERSDFSKMMHERIYCFFQVENPESLESTVTIAWEDANGNSRREPTAVDVPGRRRFRHYRYTSTSWRRPGTYSCVVRDADGEVLARAPFTLSEE